MAKSPVRGAAAGLVLALLLVFLGFPGSPVHADPPDIELPPHMGNAPSEWGWQYTYNSVSFWENELEYHAAPPADGKEQPQLDTVSWFGRVFTIADLKRIASEEAVKPDDPNLRSPKGKYKVGTLEHVLARFYNYVMRNKYGKAWIKKDALGRAELFKTWLANRYISPQDHNPKGAAFERLINGLLKLSEKGFKHNVTLLGTDFRGDHVFEEAGIPKIIFELKSGVTYKPKQADFYERLEKNGTRIIYISGEPFSDKILKKLTDRGFEVFNVPTVPTPLRHPESPPAPGGGPGRTPGSPLLPYGPTGSLNNGAQATDATPSSDAVGQSPASAEDAEATREAEDEVAQEYGYADAEDADIASDPLGGVDFSTLELRYVADTYDGGLGSGVDYAYQVEADPNQPVSFGGRESARLAADAFFTWLALRPESFTVNLNPDEPDRIIDEKFGKTDAGRVLLEADLQMKKTVAVLIHPDSKLGGEYWDALRGENKCISMRQWIVPKPAVVNESGNALHILDAPLEVKMETEYLKTKGVGGSAGCSNQSGSDGDYNEAVYRTKILPVLEKAINEAPEYADLRRVYASRVAAEWYRQRSAKKTTAFSSIIGSGDASKWPLRENWSPRDTFDRYVKSYKEGEFSIRRTSRQGNQIITRLYVYGGVNFAQVPEDKVSDRDFAARHPGRDTAVNRALDAPTAEQGTNALWLGGRSTERPVWNPKPPPASALRNPLFYALTGLPVVSWLALGVFLWRRRGRGIAAASPVGTEQVTA